MPRRLLALVAAAGCAACLFALVRPALAAAPAPAAPPDYPTVEVESVAGGPHVRGKLRATAVTLKTDVGTSTLELAHVRRVTFQREPDGTAHDTVQLADKSVVRGRVTAEQFVLDREGGGEVTWKGGEVREIRVISAVPVSLAAVIFGLLTLTAMEIILGVDNVIFLSIVVAKVPKEQQPKARKIGLGAALGTRLALLFSLSFLLGLTAPVFTLPDLGFLTDLEAREVSWRDIILFGGGLFLIAKSVKEMHEKLEHARKQHEGTAEPPKPANFAWTILTIAALDIIFSLDSVITAVGMVDELWVMVAAMVVAMVVMLVSAKSIGDFVERHPTVKVLALSFLILIGVMLVAEGLGQHIDKGYIYAAMAFAVVVEMINMRLRRPAKAKPSHG
ncbi:membrane protein : Integral membrane protein TerC OS=Anaeromyxobacter sp. (strain Fw109-5) GN=Anae109_0052 PE=4 SV=1: TerC [Gemmataceae bacterium]|nr:membrane protein : Integral membrane protein TerC OS=Anaeromyxobacter sp. (strain Fw109-5) GN=Anae109_0052 PE=4 SV=1: TerC [Gemmataceae bacterium]VTU00255.1 membrane protein : Integral membrane protein TerC OS=Anaeromyxobacter sp. (strain Fw109-5) GN=Anae109_0052 PE=4 SV=1: TerC [Gemmataceae bacterium]